MQAFLERLGPEMLRHTFEHVYLSVLAMVIAAAIALPLGICLSRCRLPRVAQGVLGLAGVVQTVPSLALIALIMSLAVICNGLFEWLALPLRLSTIGVTPALVALVLYALLPILRNTYTGLRQVDPTVKEVAVAMGMTPRQVLISVELPLALPMIMAGIRISMVWTIGVAALCSLIGAGGLGDLIIQGLQSIRTDLLFAGMVPAMLLALLFDWGLAALETWLTPPGIRQRDAMRPS